MSWIDDEIQEVEKLRLRKELNDKKIQERERILQTQAEVLWFHLREEFPPLVASFNQSSGRALLEIVEVRPYGFILRREDYVKADIQFDHASYRVNVIYLPTFSGHNKCYSIGVMPVNGVESPVWLDAQSRDRQSDGQIAALTIRTLLRCGL